MIFVPKAENSNKTCKNLKDLIAIQKNYRTLETTTLMNLSLSRWTAITVKHKQWRNEDDIDSSCSYKVATISTQHAWHMFWRWVTHVVIIKVVTVCNGTTVVVWGEERWSMKLTNVSFEWKMKRLNERKVSNISDSNFKLSMIQTLNDSKFRWLEHIRTLDVSNIRRFEH